MAGARRRSARRGGPPARPSAGRRRPKARTAAPRAASGAARSGRHDGSLVGVLDGGVLSSAGLLAALGVVMIYSTTAPLAIGSAIPPHLVRHLAALGLGLLAIGMALRIPLSLWRRLALPLWAASVLFLLATLVIGIEANGARRWLALPGLGLSFQAAELAKFATPLAAAAVLAGGRPESWKILRLVGLLVAVPAGLLLLQPDFGSAAVLVAVVGALLFAAGVPLPRLASLSGVALAGASAFMLARPYALARWTGFLAPWQNARTEGFQLVQSFVAFGRGGSFGVGLGDGRQKLSYLPEAHTDFVLSVVAEELGLVGVLLVLGAFAALAMAGLRVSRRAREPFAQLVAFGLTCFIAIPAAVNAAVVMGLLPTTGFTLPFVSFGSNSLVFCALALGILLRIGAREASRDPGGARHWRQR